MNTGETDAVRARVREAVAVLTEELRRTTVIEAVDEAGAVGLTSGAESTLIRAGVRRIGCRAVGAGKQCCPGTRVHRIAVRIFPVNRRRELASRIRLELQKLRAGHHWSTHAVEGIDLLAVRKPPAERVIRATAETHRIAAVLAAVRRRIDRTPAARSRLLRRSAVQAEGDEVAHTVPIEIRIEVVGNAVVRHVMDLRQQLFRRIVTWLRRLCILTFRHFSRRLRCADDITGRRRMLGCRFVCTGRPDLRRIKMRFRVRSCIRLIKMQMTIRGRARRTIRVVDDPRVVCIGDGRILGLEDVRGGQRCTGLQFCTRRLDRLQCDVGILQHRHRVACLLIGDPGAHGFHDRVVIDRLTVDLMRADLDALHEVARRIEAVDSVTMDAVVRDQVLLAVVQGLRRELVDHRLADAAHDRIDVHVKLTLRVAVNTEMVAAVRGLTVAGDELIKTIAVKIDQLEKAEATEICEVARVEVEIALGRFDRRRCAEARFQLVDHFEVGLIGVWHIIERLIDECRILAFLIPGSRSVRRRLPGSSVNVSGAAIRRCTRRFGLVRPATARFLHVHDAADGTDEKEQRDQRHCHRQPGFLFSFPRHRALLSGLLFRACRRTP